MTVDDGVSRCVERPINGTAEMARQYRLWRVCAYACEQVGGCHRASVYSKFDIIIGFKLNCPRREYFDGDCVCVLTVEVSGPYNCSQSCSANSVCVCVGRS